VSAHTEFHRDGYTVSTDPARLDLDVIHGYLSRSYWASGRPREVIARSIEHSLCFGVYLADEQIGFARAITDRATFAYLADVFILEPYRGQGLGKWLVECILAHPELATVRTWLLMTYDAHSLYERFGFRALEQPERLMTRRLKEGEANLQLRTDDSQLQIAADVTAGDRSSTP
jgi:GNAT superfamily N-acetyltransferase